jgi:hypothetical protein
MLLEPYKYVFIAGYAFDAFFIILVIVISMTIKVLYKRKWKFISYKNNTNEDEHMGEGIDIRP